MHRSAGRSTNRRGSRTQQAERARRDAMRDWKWALVVAAVTVPVALAWWLGTQDLLAAPRRVTLAAQEKEAPKPQIRRATEAERKAAVASIEAQLKAFKA